MIFGSARGRTSGIGSGACVKTSGNDRTKRRTRICDGVGIRQEVKWHPVHDARNMKNLLIPVILVPSAAILF